MDFSQYYGKISNSGHDQNGRYKGGKAGDQTGTEWQIISWYRRPWNVVIRLKNRAAADLLAQLAIEAANNNNIGYDQNQRTTYWTQLVASGYRPSKIKTPCEADCSEGVIDNTKAVGHLLSIPALQNLKATYTGNMVDGYKATGACEILTDPKYLNSYDYLKPGDILLNTAHHTATNLGIGKLSGYAAAAQITAQTSNAAPSKETKWQGKVTVSKLSVRSWAGEENPTLSFSPLKKDTVVYVCDTIKASDGSAWYYIKYGAKYGFVSAKYIDRITTATQTKTTVSKTPLWVGQVTNCNSLAVRTWAGKENPQLKSVPAIFKGGRIWVCDTIKDSEDSEWYYILINNSVYGFVKAKFIKKVG